MVNDLTFEVEDNGVGRKKSAQIENKQASLKKSMGMEITSDRIKMMNQLYGTNAEVRVLDLMDEKGNAARNQGGFKSIDGVKM